MELDSGTTYFFALPRTVVLHENGSVEYLPEEDGFLYVTQTETGFQLTIEGHGLAEGRAADALILTSPDRVLDWDVSNCAKAWVSYAKNGVSHGAMTAITGNPPRITSVRPELLLLLCRVLLHPGLPVPHSAVQRSARAHHPYARHHGAAAEPIRLLGDRSGQ